MFHQTSHQRPILVSLQLDHQDRSVLEAARYLARRLHAPLHIAHAIRPMFSYVGAGDVIANPYYGYEMNFTDKEEAVARDRLKSLAAKIDDVSVTTHLIRDFPAEGILNLEKDLDPGLIIAGVREDQAQGGLFTGLATGFSLASDAETPVLLVPEHNSISISNILSHPLRILVADNLEEEGAAALSGGLKLASELHAENFTHMHVRDISIDEIDRMIDTVREAMILGHIPSDPELSRETYMEKVRESTEKELRKRYESSPMRGLSATRYEPMVRFGKAADELHREVKRSDVNLIVFGRHHILHKKTLSLGKIPYHAMIEEGVMTLVVPEEKPEVFEKISAPETARSESFGHSHFLGGQIAPLV